MQVKFFFLNTNLSLKRRKELKFFIGFIFRNERRTPGSLTYIFCSDEYLLKINQDFLKHDFYTDIITFDMSSSRDEIEGEIYISTERVKENSKEHGFTFNRELHRVIFHGALHLCGYKDKSQKEKAQMRIMEDKYLDLYFK